MVACACIVLAVPFVMPQCIGPGEEPEADTGSEELRWFEARLREMFDQFLAMPPGIGRDQFLELIRHAVAERDAMIAIASGDAEIRQFPPAAPSQDGKVVEMRRGPAVRHRSSRVH